MAQYAYIFDGADTAAGSGVPTPTGMPTLEVLSGSWRRLSNRAHTDTAGPSNPMLAVTVGGGDFDQTIGVSPNGGDAVYGRVVDVNNWVRARVRRYTTTSSYSYTEYEWRRPVYRTEYLWNTTYSHGEGAGGWATHTHAGQDWGTFSSSYASSTYTHTHMLYDEVGGEANFGHSMVLKSQSRTTTTRQVIDSYETTWTTSSTQSPGSGYTYTGNSRPVSGSSTSTNYQVILEKCVAGTVTVLGTVNVSAPSSLRFRGQGTALSVYVNGSGTASLSRSDAAHATTGRVAIGRGTSDLYGHALDNWTIDTLNTPPSAPVLTVPNPVDRTRDLLIDVGFVDPDPGDSPSQSFVRYRRTDITDSWTVVAKTSPNTVVTIAANTLVAGAPYEFQGASKDAQGTPAADADLVWSGSVFRTASTPPAGATLVSPAQGASIPASTQTFTISTPELDKLQWEVLDDVGAVIEGGTITLTSTRSFTATGLDDGTTITARWRTELDGLWSDWGSSSHAVIYTPPAIPTVELLLDVDRGRISVVPTFPAPTGSQPAVESYAVLRSEQQPDGTWTALRVLRGAAELVPAQAYTDRTLTPGIEHRYQVRAQGSNDTTSLSAVVGEDFGPPPPLTAPEGDLIVQ